MALAALRSRRLLPILSTLIISRHFTLSAVSRSYPVIEPPTSSSVVHFQSRSFKSTPVSYLSSRTMNRNDMDDEKLDPDAIPFEGCDYNHWLITMDFPKGPKPSPEEMVQTYVQTCAKGLNISAEEAKKKIYACSTTTYQGFQAIMTEAESEQFQGLPGVVCILPDSYIDPVNKEYGGDKYINGTIIPRPPPVQHNRGRNDRNMPRDDNQRGPPGNFNNQQGPMQEDGRNFGPPRNMPQQNYGPPGQVPPPPPPRGFCEGCVAGIRQGKVTYILLAALPTFAPHLHYAALSHVRFHSGPLGYTPSYIPLVFFCCTGRYQFPQGGMGSNFNQPGQGNYFPQDRRGPPPGDQRGFGPSDRGVMGDNRSYPPPGGFQNPGPGASEGYGPGARVEQGPNQSFGPRAGRGCGPGARVEQGPAQGFGPGVGVNYGPGGRAEQGPSHGFGPGIGYVPGARGEQGPGQGFVPGPGGGGGYGPGARGEQGPAQGFEAGGHFGPGAGGDYGKGNQVR
ncbi:unnamed protein product [Rhodiola kirilowii]